MASDSFHTSSSTSKMCHVAACTSESSRVKNTEFRQGSLGKCVVRRSVPAGWNSERWIPPATFPFWSYLLPSLCLMGMGSFQAVFPLTLNSYPGLLRNEERFQPSMLKMRSPKVPAMVERTASSDTLKKNFAVGLLAMDLISLIRFSVSILFLV